MILSHARAISKRIVGNKRSQSTGLTGVDGNHLGMLIIIIIIIIKGK